MLIDWNLSLTEIGQNGNPSLAENFTVPKIQPASTCIKGNLPVVGEISIPCGSVIGRLPRIINFTVLAKT